jgi:hypothetical protein
VLPLDFECALLLVSLGEYTQPEKPKVFFYVFQHLETIEQFFKHKKHVGKNKCPQNATISMQGTVLFQDVVVLLCVNLPKIYKN